MKRTDKEKLVQDLQERVSKASAIFLANYQGMTYFELSEVRNAIKGQGSDFRVVKNRIFMRVLNANNINLDEALTQPTACALVYGEPTAIAKEFKKFAKEYKHFEIKAGYLDGTLLTKEEVASLADIPSKEELLAKALGSISAPTKNFVSLLANIPRSFVNVLNAIKDKKENE